MKLNFSSKKSKLIIRIILILLIVLCILTALLTIPSPETDRKVFGDKFEEHIIDKYCPLFDLEIIHADKVFNKKTKSFDSYYNHHNNKTQYMVTGPIKIDKYDDRNIYCTLQVVFYNQVLVVNIPFKGTKVIGDVYEWQMLPNYLFPIRDENVDYYLMKDEKYREWFED